MQYRSFADMNSRILQSRYSLPEKIDLVVGIPRSGLIAGNFLSIAMNIPLTDLAGLLEGRLFEAGTTKKRPNFERALAPDRTVVILDDTVGSGRALRAARERVEASGIEGKFFYCSVYGEMKSHPDADLVMESLGGPALCEWNIMHDRVLASSCFDIDGVICSNCPKADDDDGVRYAAFLTNATQLYLPTRTVKYLVTARKEKYRAQTEAWLQKHGVEYEQLIMMQPEEEKLSHGAYKGKFFKSVDALLFVESEHDQAEEIARISGKPVLSIEAQYLVSPKLSLNSAAQSLKSMSAYRKHNWGGLHNGNFSGVKIRMRQLLGDRTYLSLKRLVKR